MKGRFGAAEAARRPQPKPVLPLNDLVLFPSMVAPLVINTKRSTKLVEEIGAAERLWERAGGARINFVMTEGDTLYALRCSGYDTADPVRYYPDDDPSGLPRERWRGHAHLLYANWLNYYVYQETPYNLSEL
jgi:hypothetical protein